MTSRKYYSDLIEKYLDGELDAQESANFELELENDMELREELEFYKMANSVIIQNKISSIEDTIQEVRGEYKHRKKVRRIQRLLMGTAGFLALAGILYFTTKDPNSQKESISPSQNKAIEDSISVKQKSTTLNSNYVESPDTNYPTSEKVSKQKKASEHKKTLADNSKENKDTPVVFDNDTTSVKTNQAIKPEDSGSDTAPNEPTEKFDDKKETNICDQTHIKAIPSIYSTCLGQHEGKIQLSQVEGGTAPYTFYLSTGEKSTSGEFSNLKAGTYSILIQDQNMCSGELAALKVIEESCKLDLYLDPSFTGKVEFPVYEKAGVLSIFDKSGNELHADKLRSGEVYSWNGYTKDGLLSPGYYLFIIKFEDGTVQNGSITVVP